MTNSEPNAGRRKAGGGRPGDDIVVATGLTPTQADMLAANTGLIGFLLKTRAKHLVGGVYDEADAWQDGVFGLARAVQLFDPDRGYRFSTYALPLIFQSMQRGRGRCESKRWREAYAAQAARDWEPDLSLDYQPDDTSNGNGAGHFGRSFADLIADDSDTEGDGQACAVGVGMRSACRDPLDHAVLDALFAGAPISPLGPRFGVSLNTPRGRAERLQAVGAALYGDRVAA